MSATIHIHRTHCQHTDGRDKLAVHGNTVGTCIQELIDQYPGMQGIVYDEKGAVRNTIEIYLNMKNAFPDELERPVGDGDDIHIALLMVGG